MLPADRKSPAGKKQTVDEASLLFYIQASI